MKGRIKFILLFGVLYLLGCTVMAQSLERARDLYKAGKYDQAKPIFETLIKKSPNNSSLNQWYGVCLYETGEYNASEKYLKVAASRKIQDSYLYLGDLYNRQYRFSDALENYEKYKAMLQKSKQDTEAIDAKIAKAKMGEQMVRRVEKVQIIDSMIVDKQDFFKHYKLSPESGSLHDYNTFFKSQTKNNSSVYQYLSVNTFSDYVVGYLAQIVVNGISFLISFILATLFIRCITWATNLIAGLPVIRGVNKITGGLLGGVKFVIMIWILFLVFTVLCNTKLGDTALKLIMQDPLLNYLYDKDILIKIFMNIFYGK